MLITHEEVDFTARPLTNEADRSLECFAVNVFDSMTMDMLEVEAVVADLGPGGNFLSLTSSHLGEPRAASRKRSIMILIQLPTISIFLEDLTNPALLIAMNCTKEGRKVSFLLLLVSTSCVNICVETLCLLSEVHNVAVDGGDLLLGPALWMLLGKRFLRLRRTVLL